MKAQRAPRRSVQFTERDRALLGYAAEHRFVTAGQVAVLLAQEETTMTERLDRLTSEGFLRCEHVFDGHPSTYAATPSGLRVIDSDLPTPRRVAPGSYRHDLGLGWLMLAARAGRFGEPREVWGERRMRSRDGRDQDREERFGVRLGGYGQDGRERLHYPDLIVVLQSGHRVAFELELTTKWVRRRDEIIGAYAADPRIDAVVYLVDRVEAGRAIQRTAARAGVCDLVHVQRATLGRAPGGAETGQVRQRARARRRAGERPGVGR